MPITVSWDDAESTTLLYDWSDPWTWDDYYAVLETARQLDPGQTMRYVIIDFSRTTEVGPLAISHFSHVGRTMEDFATPPTFIFVRANRFLRALGSVMSALFPKAARDVHHVDTLEQARAYIRSRTKDKGTTT